MRIQHNIMAMNAYRNYNNNTSALSKNLEKLSSGYKINRAGDDAAGLAISEKMRAQITGLNAAQKNVKDGISLVKTAEGAMQEIQDMLNRMDYLATQSANGTYDNEVDRANLQKEVNALKTEIDRIADSANFNGIKLLDGSLADKQVATSVEVGGNAVGLKSAGGKASFEMNAAFANLAGTQTDGGTVEFNVGLDDGSSISAKFTVDATNKKLIAEDGTEYAIAAADGKATKEELGNAVVAELKKTKLGEQFDITIASDKIKLTAKEAGTDGAQVRSMDLVSLDAAGTQLDKKDIGVTVVSGLDEGREIKAADLTEYDGTNYDDAVFTINGKKFVVMAKNMDAATDTWFKATQGLGKDVTILVGGTDGLTKNDDNFTQNCNKIAEVTGLTVGDAIDETRNNPAGVTNNIDSGDGIRLSPGKGTTGGGLTLQIGDTADSYNQMKVAVGDMHTKALGIANLDISNQDGAAAAIETIRNAINQVSGVRGDLGAVQNRLEHTQNNLSVMAENIQDAESTIRDTDVAEEMMSYVKNNILVQSAQAMLAQANQVPQGVLQLLG